MAKCRPTKWVPWALLGAGLPFLAAAWLNTDSLTADVAQRAASAVSGNEATSWATLKSDGRDLTITGTAPNKEALEAAVQAVAGTYGVRTVMAQADIAPPPPPAAVNVTAAAADAKWPYPLSGSFTGKSLAATLQGQTYQLDAGPELKGDGKGGFTFAPTIELPPGSHDVEFVATDAAGATAKSVAQIVIPEPPAPAPAPAPEPAAAPEPAPAPAAAPAPEPLAAPTVDSKSSELGAIVLKGTWPQDKAQKLTVTVDGHAYTLGVDANLQSKEGKWSLLPAVALKDGVYDVVVEATAADGSAAKDASANEIEIKSPPPAPPPEPQFDCVAELAKVNSEHPLRFGFDLTKLDEPYAAALNDYANLLKDERCKELKVEVEGHADIMGPEDYNQGLSERRAQVVVKALEAAGIDAGRLSVKGFSELKPVDPGTDEVARAKNRRVEFTAIK